MEEKEDVDNDVELYLMMEIWLYMMEIYLSKYNE